MWEKINAILILIQGLGHDEILILVALGAVLLFYIFYRWFGIRAAFSLLLIYGIAYVLYTFDIINAYDKREAAGNAHLEVIQSELEKD